VKKLIFLLLMVFAMVSFVAAMETANPPGVFALEAVMSGIVVEYYAIALDTVPVQHGILIVLSSGIIALNNDIDILVVRAIYGDEKTLDTGQAVDYNLLL
jgi:hypothetical protein